MANRTNRLLIGAVLSLTLGWQTSALQAQQPKPPFPPAQRPNVPINPPSYSPPPWLKFLDDNPELGAFIFAVAVVLALCVVSAAAVLALWIVSALAWMIIELRAVVGRSVRAPCSRRHRRREGVSDEEVEQVARMLRELPHE